MGCKISISWEDIATRETTWSILVLQVQDRVFLMEGCLQAYWLVLGDIRTDVGGNCWIQKKKGQVVVQCALFPKVRENSSIQEKKSSWWIFPFCIWHQGTIRMSRSYQGSIEILWNQLLCSPHLGLHMAICPYPDPSSMMWVFKLKTCWIVRPHICKLTSTLV